LPFVYTITKNVFPVLSDDWEGNARKYWFFIALPHLFVKSLQNICVAINASSGLSLQFPFSVVGQEDKHRFEKQQTKTIQAIFGYSSVKAVIFFLITVMYIPTF